MTAEKSGWQCCGLFFWWVDCFLPQNDATEGMEVFSPILKFSLIGMNDGAAVGTVPFHSLLPNSETSFPNSRPVTHLHSCPCSPKLSVPATIHPCPRRGWVPWPTANLPAMLKQFVLPIFFRILTKEWP